MPRDIAPRTCSTCAGYSGSAPQGCGASLSCSPRAAGCLCSPTAAGRPYPAPREFCAHRVPAQGPGERTCWAALPTPQRALDIRGPTRHHLPTRPISPSPALPSDLSFPWPLQRHGPQLSQLHPGFVTPSVSSQLAGFSFRAGAEGSGMAPFSSPAARFSSQAPESRKVSGCFPPR